MMTLNVSCKSYLLLLFICVSSLHYTFAQNACPDIPTKIPNRVVFAGTAPTYTRAATDTVPGVIWQFASASATFDALKDINPNGDNNVNPVYATTFGLTSTELTVRKATVTPEPTMPDATAGLYLINYPDGCTSAGGLVVIYGGPICGLDTSDPNNIQMSCSLNFSNYIQERLNPIMNFTNNGNQVFLEEPQPTSLDLDNPGLQNSISTYPLGKCSEGTYSCTITFSAPSTDTIPPFISANAPDFNTSCTFPACASTTTQKPTTTTLTTTTTTTQSPTTTTRSPTTTTQSPTTTTTQSPTTTIPPTQAPMTTTTQSPTTTIQSPTTQSSSLTTQPPPPATTTTTASPATQAPSATISTPTASILSLISSILETTTAIVATDATATATTTSPAIATTSGSESGGLPLIIILGVVLGSLLATAAAVSCWCCCCVPVYPVGILPARRRRRRVIVRRIFFPWRREPIYQPRPQPPPPPPPQKIYYVTEEVVLAPRYFPSYRTGAYNNQWLQRNSNASYTSYQPQYARYNKPEDVRYNSFRPAYYNYY